MFIDDIDRVRNTEPDVLKKTPYFLLLLDAWYEGGDPEGVKAWVEDQSSTDPGFMDLLSNMKRWSNSSVTGVEYTIRSQTLETFFSGAQHVEHRLAEIVGNSRNTDEFLQQARDLLTNIERGKHFS